MRSRLGRADAVPLVQRHGGRLPWTCVGTALEENVDEIGLLLDEFLHGGERAARGELPMSTPSLRIAGRRIAADEPPYVAAEMSVNHGGSFARAVLADLARSSGDDRVLAALGG